MRIPFVFYMVTHWFRPAGAIHRALYVGPLVIGYQRGEVSMPYSGRFQFNSRYFGIDFWPWNTAVDIWWPGFDSKAETVEDYVKSGGSLGSTLFGLVTVGEVHEGRA